MSRSRIADFGRSMNHDVGVGLELRSTSRSSLEAFGEADVHCGLERQERTLGRARPTIDSKLGEKKVAGLERPPCTQAARWSSPTCKCLKTPFST